MAKTDAKKKPAKPISKKATAGNNGKKIPKEPPKTPIWK